MLSNSVIEFIASSKVMLNSGSHGKQLFPTYYRVAGRGMQNMPIRGMAHTNRRSFEKPTAPHVQEAGHNHIGRSATMAGDCTIAVECDVRGFSFKRNIPNFSRCDPGTTEPVERSEGRQTIGRYGQKYGSARRNITTPSGRTIPSARVSPMR